ncbi:hypothetical protein EDB89DRAFT_2017780 [Lactarius sanguifluus]|nr:hypothetical protein EDB89DRAFT_2017780 [Lactarius sanguifluus]
MVAGMAALTRLRSLSIEFKEPTPCLEQKHLYPIPIRPVLPSLTSFWFQGNSEYLEDLVARIDCPRLNRIDIGYNRQRVNFQVSQIVEFINRSEDPRLTQFGRVNIYSSGGIIALTVTHAHPHGSEVTMLIVFGEIEMRGSHVVQMFCQFSANLSDVRHLSIRLDGRGSRFHCNWVQLLRPFAALQALCVCGYRVERCVALACKDVAGERTGKLLPALDLLCLNNYSESSVSELDTAFRISGRSVTFVKTVEEFEERLGSYSNN